MKISVIIPTYNCAQSLLEAIESVLNQSFKDYEIIVIDDGSQDETKNVIDSYMKNICYIYQQNQGVACARNLGIKKAQGKYIAFLDADDIWIKDKLKMQIECFEKYPEIGLVFSDLIILNENKEEKEYKIGNFKKDVEALIQHNFIPTSKVMVKKECFEKVGMFENFNLAEDYNLWLKIIQHYSIYHIPQCLVKYKNKIRTKSYLLQTTINEIKIISNITLKNKFIIKRKLGQLFYMAGLFSHQLKKYNQSQKYFIQSILKMPFYWRTYFYIFLNLIKNKKGF
ncbi:MAG: glycosyltransferase [bacterium]